jgi:hypothetical protein
MNPFLLADEERDAGWASRANCVGQPADWFEYQEKDSPKAKGLDWKQRVMLNDANYSEAEQICLDCPVFFECGAAADEMDKYWTVRMGERPGRAVADADHLAKVGRPSSDAEARICHRGHFVPDRGRCGECRKINKRLQRERAKAEASGVE